MKKALIDSQDTYSTGYLIIQVEDSEFDVCGPVMYWVDCPDDVTRERNWYNATAGTFPVMQEVLDAEAVPAGPAATLTPDDPNPDAGYVPS